MAPLKIRSLDPQKLAEKEIKEWNVFDLGRFQNFDEFQKFEQKLKFKMFPFSESIFFFVLH